MKKGFHPSPFWVTVAKPMGTTPSIPLTSPTVGQNHAPAVPLAPVLLVNFIGTMGFSIVTPFLVFLVTGYGGDAMMYGIVSATYPVFQFVGSPVLGRWSDNVGRRKVLLLSQVGSFLSWIVFAVALQLPNTPMFELDVGVGSPLFFSLPLVVMILGRALDGLTGGNISVANAYVADISSNRDRSKNFGKMGVSANLGMILGPALASVLGTTPLKESLPVYAAALICFVGVFLILFVLPESKVQIARQHCEPQSYEEVVGQEPRSALYTDAECRVSTWDVLKRPHISFVLTLQFVTLLAFNFFYTAFPMHAVHALEWTMPRMGLFFTSLSAMLVIMQGPVLARLSQHFDEKPLILAGLPILGVNFLLMGSHDDTLVVLASVLFAVGNGIMWPSMVALIAKITEDRVQGLVQGLSGSTMSLASVIGLLAGGLLYEIIASTTFWLAAGCAFLAFLLAFRLEDRTPRARAAASR